MTKSISYNYTAAIEDAALSSAAGAADLAVDPWVASSLLQKAIRRGDADLAERAAVSLYRSRGRGIWRRFAVIAFEDVGVGSVEAVVETIAIGTNPSLRTAVGGDERALRHVARLLAQAPKDRSPDYLISNAHSEAVFGEFQCRVGAMTVPQRLDIVGDAGATLVERAVAAYYSAGVEWWAEHRVGRGDLDTLMRTFRDLGVPPELLTATRIAAKLTREPIVIMSPLLWLAAASDPAPRVIECQVPPYLMLGDVPSYVLDKHTSAGKFAIQRLVRENEAVRDVLANYVPEHRADKAAYVAAFYADAAPVSRRLDWRGSAEVERMGTEADMVDVGASPDGVSPILNVFRDNLDHLISLRAETFGRRRARAHPLGQVQTPARALPHTEVRICT